MLFRSELLAKGGEYARMFEMQARWYRSGAPGGAAASGGPSSEQEARGGEHG